MTPEQKLKKIARIFETRRVNKDGTHLTNHAYYNLEGAIIDLDRTGVADKVIMRHRVAVAPSQSGSVG